MRPNFISSLVLAFGLSAALWAGDAEVALPVDQLPAAVKEGFGQEVKGGAITSVKKVGADDQLRYRIHYKIDGKEHQLTLGTDGKPTRKKKS